MAILAILAEFALIISSFIFSAARFRYWQIKARILYGTEDSPNPEPGKMRDVRLSRADLYKPLHSSGKYYMGSRHLSGIFIILVVILLAIPVKFILDDGWMNLFILACSAALMLSPWLFNRKQTKALEAKYVDHSVPTKDVDVIVTIDGKQHTHYHYGLPPDAKVDVRVVEKKW